MCLWGELGPLIWSPPGRRPEAGHAAGMKTGRQVDDTGAGQASEASFPDGDNSGGFEAGLFSGSEFLELIVENVHDVLYLLGVEPGPVYRFLAINRAFLAATGLTKEEVVGKCVPEVLPESSHALILTNCAQALETGQAVRWEERVVFPAGERVGEVWVTPIHDEAAGSTLLLGGVHDTTERANREDVLRKSELRLTTLIQTAPNAIIVTNGQGVIQMANAEAIKTFGYSESELVGSPIERLIPERYRAKHRDHTKSFWGHPTARTMGP